MFAGPIIAREVKVLPQSYRFFVLRAIYAAMLFVLMWTAWQSQIGWRNILEIGLLSRFGQFLYKLFAYTELTLMLFFAPLAAATNIAHEKDRRTFILLLMTDLGDVEIIVGKLVISLVKVATMLATSAPVFFVCLLLGGNSGRQLVEVLAVMMAAGLLGGSIGLLVGLSRDRTFQSVALTVLVVVIWLAAAEGLAFLAPGARVAGFAVGEALQPYRTLTSVLASGGAIESGWPGLTFLAASGLLTIILNLISIKMLRIWNPGRNEPREQREGAGDAEILVEESEVEEPAPAALATTGTLVEESVGFVVDSHATVTRAALADAGSATSLNHRESDSEQMLEQASTGLHVPRRTHRRIVKAVGTYRVPWDNPIIWREIRTRAYGTRPLVIKGAYLAILALLIAYFLNNPNAPGSLAWTLIPASVLGLLLVNAQGVTALTSERDSGALDLLLVTELTPKQFIYGKLFGVLYNAKEMVVAPLAIAIWFALIRKLSIETTVYFLIDYALLCHFSAMLGLHAALTYTNSRVAIANSLGTIFFLMVGILICATLIILSDREFGRQLLSFLIFIGAGSVALFGSLGAKNPSNAIALVALNTPFWSFYCIISLLRGDISAAFLFSAGVYGFALMAMLVPAVSEFDIALGRTSAIQG